MHIKTRTYDANVDFNEINKSFKEYKKVMEIVHNGKKFTCEPNIWHSIK